MKKLYTMLLLLSVSAGLCSCESWIKEDRSDCPPPTTSFTVTFDLADEAASRAEADDFLADVDNVYVFLFDDQRLFVESKEVSRADLEEFLGATFEVVPGSYHVVAWGNVHDQSVLTELTPGVSTMDDSFIRIKDETTGNPIYYAPEKEPTLIGSTADYTIYAADVVRGEENVKPISFVNAHRKVVVYVRGFELTRWYKGQPPILQATAASAMYDFLLGADETPTNLSQAGEPVSTADGPRYLITFYSAQVPLTAQMGINIYNDWDLEATGEPIIPTIFLSDWIDEHLLTDENDLVIEIYFTQDSGVEIRLPSWIDNPVVQ